MRLLGIDRGTKKIGLARWSDQTGITFPLGYIENNQHTLATLSSFVTRYEIDTIVYGFAQNKRMRNQIKTCKEQLCILHPQCTRKGSNEAYTSVQADILLQVTNHPGQDSIAAMYIIDNYLECLSINQISNKKIKK